MPIRGYNGIVMGICTKLTEEITMPRRDGTGPAGQGSLTGRGLGNCTGARNAVYGNGYGCGYGRDLGMVMGLVRRAGYRRGFGGYYAPAPEPVVYVSQKDLLTAQQEDLKNRLEIINSQLQNLAEDSK